MSELRHQLERRRLCEAQTDIYLEPMLDPVFDPPIAEPPPWVTEPPLPVEPPEGEPDIDVEGCKPRRKRKPRISPANGLLTLQEAAVRLGCSERTVREHVKSGALRYVNIGRGDKRERMRFTDADLNTFIANQSQMKEQVCPSTGTSARRTGSSTLGAEVIAFTALPRPRRAGKRKP